MKQIKNKMINVLLLVILLTNISLAQDSYILLGKKASLNKIKNDSLKVFENKKTYIKYGGEYEPAELYFHKDSCIKQIVYFTADEYTFMIDYVNKDLGLDFLVSTSPSASLWYYYITDLKKDVVVSIEPDLKRKDIVFLKVEVFNNYEDADVEMERIKRIF